MKSIIRTLCLLVVFTLPLTSCDKDDDPTPDNVSNSSSAESSKESQSTVTASDLVDLGLSVKWASCNVGAKKPEEYGQYFAWGETRSKEVYDWSTYKYCKGSDTTLTKYVTGYTYSIGEVTYVSSPYGANDFYDNKTVLTPDEDAARTALGGKYRTPTLAEWEELFKNCDFLWTQINGVNGCKVTSKKRGYTDKSIFFPAAGGYDTYGLYGQGFVAAYWSSTMNQGSGTTSQFATASSFSGSGRSFGGLGYRCHGYPVRPVWRSSE